MQRIFLFLATTVAMLAVLAIASRVFGLDSYLDAQGGIDLISLLIFAAIIGFSRSLISLAMSKKAAKWSTRAQVIEQPGNASEHWLLTTVQRHAQAVGIGMPEVAVFDSPAPVPAG